MHNVCVSGSASAERNALRTNAPHTQSNHREVKTSNTASHSKVDTAIACHVHARASSYARQPNTLTCDGVRAVVGIGMGRMAVVATTVVIVPSQIHYLARVLCQSDLHLSAVASLNGPAHRQML